MTNPINTLIRSTALFALAAGLLFSLTGCGQKGALTLPQDDKAPLEQKTK